MKQLIKIFKGEKQWADVYHYLLGNYRYFLYYSLSKKGSKSPLMRQHIFEQINKRCFEWMDKKCFMDGQCKICECKTTALQMCNKPCDKPCYPSMMSKYKWQLFKNGRLIIQDNGGTWFIKKNGELYNSNIKTS